MMRYDTRKMKSRGYGLVEVMIVVAILGILSGMIMLAFGRNSNNSEATALMANLEAAKNALLAYSMENKTRNVDPLNSFVGQTSSSIKTRLDKYLDYTKATCFDTLSVAQSGGNITVGFNGLAVSSGIANALDRKIKATGGAYTGSGGAGTYTMWLRVR